MPVRSGKTVLSATDQQQSVLNILGSIEPRAIAYTPYGHRTRKNGILSLLGFNGELPDPLTGHYHLGKGYRQFNPTLMRFNSPDSWSPFGAGGLNAYAYCGGDPINRTDPTGHFWGIGKAFRRLFGLKPKRPTTVAVSKKAAARNIHHGKNLEQPSISPTGTDIDVSRYSQRELNAQIAAFKKFEQARTVSEAGRVKTFTPPVPEQSPVSSKSGYNALREPLHSERYENYLNNSMGSANNAPLDELIGNHTWLLDSPGPSRLFEKHHYTMEKIRSNIDKNLI